MRLAYKSSRLGRKNKFGKKVTRANEQHWHKGQCHKGQGRHVAIDITRELKGIKFDLWQ
jgi:hypothetical protein